MQEKIKNIIQNIKLSQKQIITIISVTVLVVIAGGVFVFYLFDRSDSANLANNNFSGEYLTVAVAGNSENLIAGNIASNNSWPGEIISLNNLQVQPAREGTISEWYVHIGERVYKGQNIGKLSRPPQMPDAIMSLAEKSQMLSEAKTNVEALRIFTTKRISELKQLRIDTENSNKNKINLLTPDSLENDNASLSLISSKRKMAQTILRGSLLKSFPMITTQTILPQPGSNFNLQYIKPGFGVSNSSLRNSFPDIISQSIVDLQNPNITPEKSGLLYFETTIKLVSFSAPDGEMLTQVALDSLRDMLITDQSEFVTILGEIKSMELEKVNTQRESIDTLAEIDEKIADLEKDLAMSEGELIAKKIAYETMQASINGGYFVTAPIEGVVSSIMKRPGEFVEPGMPVATVSADNRAGVLVRIRMPNNIQKPKIGDMLSVVRPGFGTNIQKAKLVGIGNSLDQDGSYMADAVFVETNNWSVGSSVRIIEPVSSSTMFVKYSSIIFDDKGLPFVWAVSEADRIFAKKITIGRTLGELAEIYSGLLNGDRYIENPTLEIKEDMFLSDIVKVDASDESSGDSDGDMHME